MSGGTINISRSLWDDPAFLESEFSEREAWVWMIAEASWKPREKRIGKVIVKLERGQLAHSTRFLSDAWGWSHSRVRRFLERLENRHMVCRQSDTGVSVISITNYGTYQYSSQASGTVSAQQRHSSGTNDKKVNKDKKEYIGDFDAFWDAVPKKIGKGGARKAWAAACKKADPAAITDAMKEFAASVAGKDQQFIPHPTTWLNQERWADEAQKDTRTWRQKPESEWTRADRDAALMARL